jgi:hypothetical protein
MSNLFRVASTIIHECAVGYSHLLLSWSTLLGRRRADVWIACGLGEAVE